MLTSAGFTVYFIAHSTDREEVDSITGETYVKRYPKGDKRAVDPICDLCDIIGYVKPNGVDEEGKEIPSSIYFKNTLEYKARSRFDYMVDYLEVFSAENLQEAIKNAVKLQEENEGITAISYEEQKQLFASEGLSFDKLQKDIKSYVKKLKAYDKLSEYQAIVDEYLGQGAKVSEATEKQNQQLELILNAVKDLCDKLEAEAVVE